MYSTGAPGRAVVASIAEPLEMQDLATSSALLQEICSELRSLALGNPVFATVFFSRGAAAFKQLRVLRILIDTLECTRDPSRARQVKRRAAELIHWLSREFDVLMSYAAGDVTTEAVDRASEH